MNNEYDEIIEKFFADMARVSAPLEAYLDALRKTDSELGDLLSVVTEEVDAQSDTHDENAE